MTYHPVRWTPVALGDSIDDCVHEGLKCTPEVDAQVESLSKTWRPTGYFSPADVRALIGQVLAANRGAWDAVIKAMDNTIETQLPNLRASITQLSRVGDQALVYLEAARNAELAGAGTAVEAPGLRDWVLFSLNKGTSAAQAAYIATCVRPGALQLIGMVLTAWAGLAKNAIDFARKIVGIAADVVIKSVKAAEDVVDVTAWLIRWTPPIGVAALGLWLYWKYGRKRK